MSDSDPRRYRPWELGELLLDPGWADAAGSEYLVVDLRAPQDATEPDLPQRLAALPVPVVGFGAGRSAPLAGVMDVWADTEEDLAAILTAVRANPTACAVLVQVLRSTGRLSVTEGLTLESLGYATLQSGAEFARWLAGHDRRHQAAAKPPAEGPVLLTLRGRELEIVLNVPDNRNALSTAMRDGLTEAFELAVMDADIGHVDVRANGPCFSSGGDLTEFGTTEDPSSAHGIRMRRMPARYLAPVAERCHFHVHGACVGAGIELAAFAGRLTAAADAFFQLPEVAMGLIPGAGGCVSIPRRIGRQRTAYMALTNRRIGAHEALTWGLVDAVEE